MWNEASFLTHCPQPLICFVSISARDYPAVPSMSNAGHPGTILDCFRPPPPLTDRCLWQFYRPYPASLAAPLMENPPACWRPGFDPWAGKIPWRRERLPTPVFRPGEFRGLGSPWGCKELDTTECLSLSLYPVKHPRCAAGVVFSLVS